MAPQKKIKKKPPKPANNKASLQGRDSVPSSILTRPVVSKQLQAIDLNSPMQSPRTTAYRHWVLGWQIQAFFWEAVTVARVCLTLEKFFIVGLSRAWVALKLVSWGSRLYADLFSQETKPTCWRVLGNSARPVCLGRRGGSVGLKTQPWRSRSSGSSPRRRDATMTQAKLFFSFLILFRAVLKKTSVYEYKKYNFLLKWESDIIKISTNKSRWWVGGPAKPRLRFPSPCWWNNALYNPFT